MLAALLVFIICSCNHYCITCLCSIHCYITKAHCRMLAAVLIYLLSCIMMILNAYFIITILNFYVITLIYIYVWWNRSFRCWLQCLYYLILCHCWIICLYYHYCTIPNDVITILCKRSVGCWPQEIITSLTDNSLIVLWPLTDCFMTSLTDCIMTAHWLYHYRSLIVSCGCWPQEIMLEQREADSAHVIPVRISFPPPPPPPVIIVVIAIVIVTILVFIIVILTIIISSHYHYHNHNYY